LLPLFFLSPPTTFALNMYGHYAFWLANHMACPWA